jgi:hypothetical protein
MRHNVRGWLATIFWSKLANSSEDDSEEYDETLEAIPLSEAEQMAREASSNLHEARIPPDRKNSSRDTTSNQEIRTWQPARDLDKLRDKLASAARVWIDHAS